MLSNDQVQAFQETLWNFYAANERDLLWRQPEPDGNFDPYKILVSEIMLQQTQVVRVTPKYQEFLLKFPTVSVLATSSLSDVLEVWQGLGYSRRARFLREAAWMIEDEFAGEFPGTIQELVKLPGVGVNTAGAIMNYAYNQPTVFVETNVRTVYIHHFFADRTDVHDRELLPLIEATMNRENPREFYWALMDYGTYLKQTVGNLNRASKHYAKQSTFEGSARQVRGEVLRQLQSGPQSLPVLQQAIVDDRLQSVLDGLQRDQMIVRTDDLYHIAH